MPTDDDKKTAMTDDTSSDTKSADTTSASTTKMNDEPEVVTVKTGKAKPEDTKMSASMSDSSSSNESTSDLSKMAMGESKEEDSSEKTAETDDDSDDSTAEKDPENPPESAQHKNISSFSLLDADSAEKDESDKDDKSKAEKRTSFDAVKKDDEKDWTELTGGGEKEEKKKFSFKPILIALVLVAIAGVIGGGIYYYTTQVQKAPAEEPQQPAVPTQIEQPVDTDNMKESTESGEMTGELDLTKYSVSILNGSGIPGEAGKVEDLLTDAGFKEMTTGNASSYDYKTTEVSLKNDTPIAVFEAINKALGDTYTIEQIKDKLPDSSKNDVEVIVGARK